MEHISIFIWLVFTHFVADWIFQSYYQAKNKAKNYKALISHCLVYTLFFILPFYIFQINFLWLIFIFISHMILDKRDFLYWILKNIKQTTLDNTPEYMYNLLLITIDQVFHLLILWGIVLM